MGIMGWIFAMLLILLILPNFSHAAIDQEHTIAAGKGKSLCQYESAHLPPRLGWSLALPKRW